MKKINQILFGILMTAMFIFAGSLNSESKACKDGSIIAERGLYLGFICAGGGDGCYKCVKESKLVK
ncbi:MAG: hypothetical protein LAT68_05480 [Cyclobacteriaceae bacterium]|nr:hypothetical protein [Cyclobacteriaceae bacterium]MCH8515762.1 hypothetical protein [Cyclobacteriaceae bacterium]